eukprot:TRINITY_DN41966_c0_g1_i2.p1 TRINITY_DN41966_c0_g1~~TRINITY_DN41966_c0_g1_i2.p1  ORF type:complete len:302 (+),score=49.93 TRINITY_DN41966_c0_g1_i2:75-980(+)
MRRAARRQSCGLPCRPCRSLPRCARPLPARATWWCQEWGGAAQGSFRRCAGCAPVCGDRQRRPAAPPARTECFAQLLSPTESPVREGAGLHKLSEAVSGRPLRLYKERVGNKQGATRGCGGAGYLPHQDLYWAFDAAAEGSGGAVKRSAVGAAVHPGGLLGHDEAVIVMLAVDDHTEANGCLEITAGSHHSPLSFDHFDGGATSFLASTGGRPSAAAGPLRWQAVPLQAGDVVIYGNLTVHRSGPNSTPGDRRALFAVYTAAERGDMRTAYYRHWKSSELIARCCSDGQGSSSDTDSSCAA